MTVRDLIDALMEFPGDLPVVVEGYEAGYDDCTGAERMRVRLNVYTEWYFGKHASAGDDDTDATEVVCVG